MVTGKRLKKPQAAQDGFGVYFKTREGKLSKIHAGNCAAHADAILEVQDSLLASGEGYNEPVLAVIKGGK